MNQASDPLISLVDIQKIFRTEEIETHALSGINLQIARGDFVALTGPSGCGKSTLLSIMGLLDEANAGSYFIRSKAVSQLSGSQRASLRNREIGFIFQAFNLIQDLSVEANVDLPLSYRNDISKAERRECTAHALQLVGMGHRSKHYPNQLSGGQQQRVAIARALAGKPAIILADEPTGNLDSKNGEAVMKLLELINAQGATLCMVTHDIQFAHRAKRVVYMIDGSIVEEAAFNRLRDEQDVSMETALAMAGVVK